MEAAVSDRRKRKRLPVKVGVFCQKVGSLCSYSLKGETVDICPEGLLIETVVEYFEGKGQDFAVGRGDLCIVELDVPDSNTAKRFDGKVSAYARVVRVVDSLPHQRTAKKHIAFQFCSRPRFDF